MSERSMDTLIDDLAGQIAPVKPLAHPFLRALPWMAATALYTVAAVYVLGLRREFLDLLSDHVLMYEVIVMLGVSFSAALAASWMCVPDMRGQRWLAAVPLTLLGSFLVWSVLRGYAEGASLQQITHMTHCAIDGTIMATLPAAFIMFLSRRGKTTRPFMMAAMNGLAVGGMGYIGLRFTCINDTVGHSCVFHIVPFVVFGLILGALARRLYRW